MLKYWLFSMCLLALTPVVYAFELDFTSLRTTVSKPSTSHTLILRDPVNDEQKTVFNLTPIDNERLGLFVDVNGIEIGYAVDVFEDDIETKTENFILAYRKFKYSKITFNYQTLEGLQTESEDLRAGGAERQFLSGTKSTKIELFGQHNLYTFNHAEPLFEHFFLNRPRLSNQFDWSLSIVGGWSYKHLKLESDQSILFSPTFLDQPVPETSELESDSFSADIGPFLSISLPNNFNAFAEYKIGRGYITNQNSESGLKDSGDEKATALGGGLSWTSSDQKTLVLLRAWQQEGRHIETSFGDLSVVWFF